MSGEYTILFVKGFERTLTDEYLRSWFEKYCKGVKHAKVAKDCYGKPLDYGYVSFYTHDYAKAAIYYTDNRKLNGRALKVEAFKSSKVLHELSNRNVFVKGFGDAFNKKELRIYFRDHVGDVESAEVVKDDNGISKGYGYVSFYKYQDAVNAVRKINGRKVNGKALTVEFFKPKEQREPKPICNVYVKGFSKILDDEDFKDLFKIFGKILSAKVEKDANGKSKGYGYVCFESERSAEAAIKNMNGYKMNSNVITVCPFRTKEERQKDIKNRNLHIRNLHESVSDGELRKIFQPYGKVLSSVVSSCPIEGKNQGFVCFETAEEADNAIAALDHQFYKGCRLQVSVLQTKESQTKERKDLNFTASKRQSHEYPERTPSVPNDRKNVHKFKSLGNLHRNSGNLRIAANFSHNQSHKKLEKGTNQVRSDEKDSLEKSSGLMLDQDLSEQSGSRSSLYRFAETCKRKTMEKAGGKSVFKAEWNAS